MDTAVQALNGLGDEETLLTKQRHARSLVEAVEKVDSKKHSLEEAYKKLIAHLHELKKEDFKTQTSPEEMAEQKEQKERTKQHPADAGKLMILYQCTRKASSKQRRCCLSRKP